jgi:hypothetical protein
MIQIRFSVRDLFDRLGSAVSSSWCRVLCLSFVFGFVIRFAPEILTSPYPIGFDPIWYAWRIKSGIVWYHWSQVFSTWLLYGILVPLYGATQASIFSLLKVVAAVLFGFNACGMCYFANKGLGWSTRKSLVASVFFTLQAASLFISANLYRNMLGLGILLFALPLIRDELRSKKQLLALALLSMLVVLGHEVASIILFATVFGFVVTRLLARRGLVMMRRLIAVVPAFAFLVMSFFFMVSPPLYQMDANGLVLKEPNGNYQGALIFFSNYLNVNEAANQYAVYSDLVSQILSSFGLLYILMLPLVLVGIFRDVLLDSWAILALIGSFGAVVLPVFAPSIWSRWMLMLVFPFTFYAVNGIEKILQLCNHDVGPNVRLVKWGNLQKKAVTLAVMISILAGLVFAVQAMPAQISVVPLADFADTVKAVNWVDSQMDRNSVLLAHFAFNWWSSLYLDEGHMRISFKDDADGALSLALQRGFSDIYLIWWKGELSCFTLTVPSGFSPVFSSGRICVLKFGV